MLVLGRKVREAVIIDIPSHFMGSAKITFRILDVQGESVKVGIEAPREIDIAREEIHGLPIKQREAV